MLSQALDPGSGAVYAAGWRVSLHTWGSLARLFSSTRMLLSNLRALIFVSVIAMLVFSIGRKGLAPLISWEEQQRLYKLLAVVSCAAFVIPNIWLYLGVLGVAAYTSRPPPGDTHLQAWRVTVWFWLLLAVPAIPVNIPGVGGIGYFFEISHIRVLCLLLLLPEVFEVRSKKQGFGSHPVDLCVAAYLVGPALVLLFFYDTTVTDWIRVTFLTFVDVWLPYWAVSRVFQTREHLRRGLAAMVVLGMALGVVGVFEMQRAWAFYGGIEDNFDVNWSLTIYLMRDGYLRAQVTSGHSLAFAFACVLNLGLWIWLREHVTKVWLGWLGLLALVAGVGASLSRGSWMACLLSMGLLALMSRKPVRNLIIMGVLSVVAVMVAAAFVPSFQELINKIIEGKSGGDGDDSEKEYRQALFETSVALISQSPWFGVPNAYAYMEHLRQGQGIIDVVNTYLAIALSYGMTALAPFVLMFLINLWRMWTLRLQLGLEQEGGRAATAMIAVTVSVMVMIFSTSSIAAIPYLYFALNGAMVALDRLYRPVPEKRAFGRTRKAA